MYREGSNCKNVVLKEYSQRKMGREAPFPSCSTSTHIGQVYLLQRVAKHYLIESLRLQEDHSGWEATAIFLFYAIMLPTL